MHKTDIDPELARQLRAARNDELVEAVFILRQSGTAPQSQLHADALLKRMDEKYAKDEVEMNYMPRMGALVVRARPDVIEWLIDQPEVEIASANQL